MKTDELKKTIIKGGGMAQKIASKVINEIKDYKQFREKKCGICGYEGEYLSNIKFGENKIWICIPCKMVWNSLNEEQTKFFTNIFRIRNKQT